MGRLGATSIVALGLAVGASGCVAEPAVIKPDVKAALLSLSALTPDLAAAHDTVRRECLATHGYELVYNSSVTASSNAALIGVAGLFASESAARDHGYLTTLADDRHPIDIYSESLTPEERETFQKIDFGTDENLQSVDIGGGATVSRSLDGCFADADRAVYGSVENALKIQNFVNELGGQSQAFLGEAEASLHTPLDNYTTCMSDAGYSVTGLNADQLALDLFGKYRLPGEPPSGDEQELALIDYDCQEKAGFASTLNQVFLDRAASWISENEAHILGLQELLSQSLDRARAIVNGA